MGYRTKADHIRALLKEGKTKKEAARLAGASYTQVHGLWTQMSGTQRSGSIRAQAIAASKPAKPFTPGDRVIHRRQLDKDLYGVVLRSDPYSTVVRFAGPKQLKHPAYLSTRDLIRALAPNRS